MSLKHNLLVIILGLFLFKIAVLDFARNWHPSNGREVASTPHRDMAIR